MAAELSQKRFNDMVNNFAKGAGLSPEEALQATGFALQKQIERMRDSGNAEALKEAQGKFAQYQNMRRGFKADNQFVPPKVEFDNMFLNLAQSFFRWLLLPKYNEKNITSDAEFVKQFREDFGVTPKDPKPYIRTPAEILKDRQKRQQAGKTPAPSIRNPKQLQAAKQAGKFNTLVEQVSKQLNVSPAQAVTAIKLSLRGQLQRAKGTPAEAAAKAKLDLATKLGKDLKASRGADFSKKPDASKSSKPIAEVYQNLGAGKFNKAEQLLGKDTTALFKAAVGVDIAANGPQIIDANGQMQAGVAAQAQPSVTPRAAATVDTQPSVTPTAAETVDVQPSVTPTPVDNMEARPATAATRPVVSSSQPTPRPGSSRQAQQDDSEEVAAQRQRTSVARRPANDNPHASSEARRIAEDLVARRLAASGAGRDLEHDAEHAIQSGLSNFSPS